MANGEGMNKAQKMVVGAGLGIPAAALLLIGSYKAKVDNNCADLGVIKPKVQQMEVTMQTHIAEARQVSLDIKQEQGRQAERSLRIETKLDALSDRIK